MPCRMTSSDDDDHGSGKGEGGHCEGYQVRDDVERKDRPGVVKQTVVTIASRSSVQGTRPIGS